MKQHEFSKAEAPSIDLLKTAAEAQLAKARVSSYTRADGTFVKEHDNGRSAAAADAPAAPKPSPAEAPAQKVRSALYDDDKAALGRHTVGDKVVSGRYGKSGTVKGARDGRVVVEHAGGYTESYRHQDLSPAGDKGTQALKEKLAQQPKESPVAPAKPAYEQKYSPADGNRNVSIEDMHEKLAAAHADGFEVTSMKGGKGGETGNRPFGRMINDDHHVVEMKHKDGRQQTVTWNSGKAGHSVTVHDGQSDKPMRKAASTGVPLLFRDPSES